MTTALIAIHLSAAPAPAVLPEPMLDGSCEDHSAAVAPISLGPGVRLYLRQTQDHVWLCYSAPAQSYAVADLTISSPEMDQPLNLHASAQLGEWEADSSASGPSSPTDGRWWRISGWVATTNHLTGAKDGGFRVLHAPGREFQISKARFGRGDWAIRLAIGGLRGPDGAMTERRWPDGGDAYLMQVD